MEGKDLKRMALAFGLLLLFPATSALLLWDQHAAETAAPFYGEGAVEWRRLVEQLRPQLKDGDMLRIVPAWDAAGRKHLQGSVPGSEAWPFSALDWREPADPIPWMSFTRLVRVGWRDRVEADMRAFPLGAGAPTLLGATEGLIAMGTPLPPSPMRWRGFDHLPNATVERIYANGDIKPCTWDKDHHKCPGKSKWWREVRNLLVDVGDLPRECVFVQPDLDGSRVEVSFHRVQLQPGDTILLRAGNTIQAARKNRGSSVSVELRIQDTIVFREYFHRNDYLLMPWALRYPDDAEPGRYRITISVSAKKSAWRQTCFDLHILEPGWQRWGAVGYGHAFNEAPASVALRWAPWPAHIPIAHRGSP
jgi:hypothetical protein